MKSIKKLGAILLATMMLFGNGVYVNAAETVNTEDNPMQEAVTSLKEGYSEYYNILDTKTTLCSSEEIEGNVENTYLLEMTVVLKAKSVEEMDYYKGITNYCVASVSKLSKLRSAESLLRMNMLSSEQSEIYEGLEEYIGKEQNLVFYVKETYPINREEEKVVLFENGVDYVSVEQMLPSNSKEISQNGYATMALKDSEYTSTNSVELKSLKAYSYSVADAVSYMKTYTSNPTVCSICGTQCKSRCNPSKYNSNYKNHADIHADCANYVSQALSNGGIPEDNKWKPESGAWVAVADLTSYMTNNGYWSSVSSNVVQNGDIIRFKNESHVVMITAFDGTTYSYSGHTRDRLNVAISLNSTSAYYYRVG